jgi:putative ABC transport system permease protein
MLRNFIKVTLRHISAHKSFTAINILGLSIGIACSLIIFIYVLNETSYDKFHSNASQIFRVTVHGQLHGVKFDVATSSGMIAKADNSEINQVKQITRAAKFGAWLISNGNKQYNEDNLFFVDTNFLKVFDGFKLLSGNKDSLFYFPGSMVLTEKTALKYFGTTSVVGKKLNVEANERPFVITGVLENPPSNTHIPFDMLASLVTYDKNASHWTTNNVYTYVQLKDNVSADTVLKQINSYARKFVLKDLETAFDNAFAPGDSYSFQLQRLTDIHLHSELLGEMEQNSKAIYVYSFAIVALLVLIIACLNFMNLSSANSINRSQEVILRKVSGAGRREIILQFITESVIYSFVALILSLLLIELILPAFNSYLKIDLDFHSFKSLPATIAITIFAIIVGIFAGSYPAYIISKFEPAKIIQGSLGQGLKNSKVRAIFVVIQFSISITIITLSIIIFSQTRYMMKKDLGFDNEHIMVIRRSDALKMKIDDFKREIGNFHGVISATNSNSIPGRDFNSTTFKLKDDKNSSALLLNQVFVNYDFCKAFNLEMLQGRFFDPQVSSDSFSCVINESAARLIGLSYPVGSILEQPKIFKKFSSNYTIIGVVKDFHFQSVDKPIQPLIMCFMRGNLEGYINVKISPSNYTRTISEIETTWKKYAPDYPFVYFFLNEDFNKNYDSLVRLGRIFVVLSMLAIFIASLGLFGLISFILNHRYREIGIRKALGASVFGLIIMMIKETMKLLLISAVIAWILSFILSKWWLNSFYYHISLSCFYFIISAIIVMVISLSTVVYKAYRTSVINAGDSLKYE